jgi:hypothetical protein
MIQYMAHNVGCLPMSEVSAGNIFIASGASSWYMKSILQGDTTPGIIRITGCFNPVPGSTEKYDHLSG